MATYTAPTTVNLSNDLCTPNGALLLTWSGANPGSDTIQGYIVQYSDDNIDWNDYATYITSNTYGESIVEMPSTRGLIRYFRVGIYGTLETTIIYSSSTNAKVNNLPLTPSVFTHDNNGNERLIVPYNHLNNTNVLNYVYYTITPNHANDDLEDDTQTFYYSIGSPNNNKTLITTSGNWFVTWQTDQNTLARYYIFAYDGMEYSEPFNVNITVNSLPVVTSCSLTTNYNIVGPNSCIMCTSIIGRSIATGSHDLKSNFKIEYSNIYSPFTIVANSGYIFTNNSISNDTTILLNNTEMKGKYFRIKTIVYDKVFLDDYTEYTDVNIFYFPNNPSANNLVINIGAYNDFKTDENRFLTLADTVYNNIYQYRNKFYYYINSFTSKNNSDGYGKIVSAKIYYNYESSNGNGINNNSIYNLTISNNNYTYNTTDRQVIQLTNNTYTKVYASISLTDEFNNTYIYNSEKLTRNTDSLTSAILNLSYDTSFTTKTGLPVYDIIYNANSKIIKFVFTNLFNYLPSSFIADKWQNVISNFTNYTFLNENITINSNSASTTINGNNIEVTLNCGTNSSYLLNSTTEKYNSIENASFALKVRDVFGDVHSIETNSNINMDFRDTPRIIINTGLSPIDFYYTTNENDKVTNTWFIYPNMLAKMKFNVKIFNDRNIENESNNYQQLNTILKLYETVSGTTYLRYTNNNTNWQATGWENSPTFTFNAGKIPTLFTNNLRTLELRLSAKDETGLESAEYVIGNIILTPRQVPSVIKNNGLSYITDTTISGTYDCTLSRFAVGSDYTITTVVAYINPNTTMDGSATEDSLSFTDNLISFEDKTIPNYTLSNTQEKITLSNAIIVLSVTYYDGETILYSSNAVKVLADIPLISVRKKALSINQLFEQIDTAEHPNSEVFIYSQNYDKNKIYFVYEGPNSELDSTIVTKTASIDLKTSEIDGMIIDGGTW